MGWIKIKLGNRKYKKIACEKMEDQTKLFYFNLWKKNYMQKLN
jgi:hypothetical protein